MTTSQLQAVITRRSWQNQNPTKLNKRQRCPTFKNPQRPFLHEDTLVVDPAESVPDSVFPGGKNCTVPWVTLGQAVEPRHTPFNLIAGLGGPPQGIEVDPMTQVVICTTAELCSLPIGKIPKASADSPMLPPPDDLWLPIMIFV